MENNQKDNGVLTPVNVIAKCKKYAEQLKVSVPQGEKCPLNKEILMSFSFYMDYAVNWTNLVIASKIHDIIIAYILAC